MPLTADDIETIRFLRAKQTRAAMIMRVFGFGTVDALLDAVLATVPERSGQEEALPSRDHGGNTIVETAPSGAPAAGDEAPRRQSAGTAAVDQGATGQPLNGVDEMPPLRKAVECARAHATVNVIGQSARPISSQARPPIPLPAPKPPSARPLPAARPGSPRDLACQVEQAIAAGAAVKRCPTAIAAPTEGARVSAADADALRQHQERREAANGFGWKRSPKGGSA